MLFGFFDAVSSGTLSGLKKVELSVQLRTKRADPSLPSDESVDGTQLEFCANFSSNPSRDKDQMECERWVPVLNTNDLVSTTTC